MSSKSTKRKPQPAARRSPLALILILAGAGLLILALIALRGSDGPSSAGIQVQGEPRLQVDQELVDHGDVKLGTVINDRVRLTNVGDQPLRITERPYIQVLEGC